LKSKRLDIFTDGACSGNPGPAGIGFVITEQGRLLKECSQYIGEATNNIAEYTALIYALQEALILKADEVSVKSDSELMCRQLQGIYKVKNLNIKPLFDQVQHLIRGFRSFSIEHVLREHNKEADRLSKKAIKKQVPVFASVVETGEESPSSEG